MYNEKCIHYTIWHHDQHHQQPYSQSQYSRKSHTSTVDHRTTLLELHQFFHLIPLRKFVIISINSLKSSHPRESGCIKQVRYYMRDSLSNTLKCVLSINSGAVGNKITMILIRPPPLLVISPHTKQPPHRNKCKQAAKAAPTLLLRDMQRSFAMMSDCLVLHLKPVKMWRYRPKRLHPQCHHVRRL